MGRSAGQCHQPYAVHHHGERHPLAEERRRRRAFSLRRRQRYMVSSIKPDVNQRHLQSNLD